MSLKKRVRFIVNPISGIGRQKTIETLVPQHLNLSLFDFDIQYTKAPKHATELAQIAAKENIDIVAIVGGDGSVNEVATGLVNSSTAMAIIPAGSGNGLARHLKIPVNLKKAIQLLNSGKSVLMDSANLNQASFFNVAGVGFDALIAHEFENYGKRGLWSYIKLFFREYPKYDERDFKITINNKIITKKAFLISIANGTQFGNNAIIAPNASINDGLLNVVIIKNIGWYNFLYVALRLFLKNIDRTRYCETITTSSLSIEQSDRFAHIDGDPISTGNKIDIKLNPKSLKVICP